MICVVKWLDEDNNKNCKEVVKILVQLNYVGVDYDVIVNSMMGIFEYEKGDKCLLLDFNVFFCYNVIYFFYSDVIWYLI